MVFTAYSRLAAALMLVLPVIPIVLDGAAATPNPGLKYYYPAPDVPVVDVEADVIVYGGTSGGVVAAVQAVRMGKSVALVVFGRHVGGMTSGGLTYTDGVSSTVQGGITREYFNATGNRSFTPSKAELEFENLLADPVPGASWDSPVPTYFEQRIDYVEKDGARIVALRMENGSVFRGRMFIDCSYEGDLLARAGVSYTYGRESEDTYSESRAGKTSTVTLPGVNAYNVEGDPSSGLIYNLINEPRGPSGEGDDHVQAYNFRMYTVQNSNPASIQPVFEPDAYNAGNFEILYRYHRSGGSTTMQVGNDINNHELFNRGCATDHIGGNRWPDGNGGWIAWADADYATRELIYQSHVAWQLGMLWYIQHDARYRALATDPSLDATIRSNIQALLNKVDQLGFPLGEYPETNGWPHELYVREARRMVSDLVITQAHYARAIVVEDSVGLANYSADSHHVRRIPGTDGSVLVEGDTGGSTATPWRIPYRALVPKKSECENLLASWAISASHVAFCSTRMEPCHMVLSQSAATAAALSIDRAEAVQDLPYDVLKRHLIADGQILGTDPAPETGIIIDNADSPGFATVGSWITSNATSGYYGYNYLHDDNTADNSYTATFTPDLPQIDDYQVFLRWTSDSNRADNVPVDIVHAGGTNTFTVNQRSNGGVWYLLGTFSFNAGSEGRVVVRNNGANGYVVADAVKFVGLSQPSVDGTGVHVIATDPVAEEVGAVPARIQFVRDTDSIDAPVVVNFSVSGSAVAGTHYTPLPSAVTIPAAVRSVSLNLQPIPDTTAQGTRTVTVTLQPGAGYPVGLLNSAIVSILDKPYDAWRHRHFSAASLENAAESEPGANPDNDDKVNRMEFVLGTDPLSGMGEGSPELRFVPASQTLTFQYWHRGEARSTEALTRFSSSLEPGNWQELPEQPETLEWVAASGDRLLQYTLPAGPGERIFLRLEIP